MAGLLNDHLVGQPGRGQATGRGFATGVTPGSGGSSRASQTPGASISVGVGVLEDGPTAGQAPLPRPLLDEAPAPLVDRLAEPHPQQAGHLLIAPGGFGSPPATRLLQGGVGGKQASPDPVDHLGDISRSRRSAPRVWPAHRPGSVPARRRRGGQVAQRRPERDRIGGVHLLDLLGPAHRRRCRKSLSSCARGSRADDRPAGLAPSVLEVGANDGQEESTSNQAGAEGRGRQGAAAALDTILRSEPS